LKQIHKPKVLQQISDALAEIISEASSIERRVILRSTLEPYPPRNRVLCKTSSQNKKGDARQLEVFHVKPDGFADVFTIWLLKSSSTPNDHPVFVAPLFALLQWYLQSSHISGLQKLLTFHVIFVSRSAKPMKNKNFHTNLGMNRVTPDELRPRQARISRLSMMSSFDDFVAEAVGLGRHCGAFLKSKNPLTVMRSIHQGSFVRSFVEQRKVLRPA
jgi:hypothetical protein